MNTHTSKVFIRFLLIGIVVFASSVIVFYGGDERQYTASISDTPQYQDLAILNKAWELPIATRIKDNFEYQKWLSFCGPTSAVNVFRSVDDNSYTQSSIFDNSKISYWKTIFFGMTLDEMAEIMRDNSNWQVETIRGLTIKNFRNLIKKSNDPSQRYIINFNRLPLFNVDIGHHSPIGGYLENEDLVFVLDVHEDYKPFLVSTERLYSAMNTIDSETGKLRGLVAIKIR